MRTRIEIHYLAEHPEFVETLAQWHYAQWKSMMDDDSVARRVAVLTARSNWRAIPTILVAIEDDELCGSAALIESDMETRPGLTPWLSEVYVAPEFRRRGIASMLVRRMVDEARGLQIPLLYLFTTGPWREQLYAGLGWSVLERPSYRNVERVIMSIRP